MLQKLQPSAIWHYFNEICQIPRPSKKEEQIIQYLHVFAKTHELSIKTDSVSNVLITKNASKGQEHKPTVVLQSHLDMVCEKNETTIHNFDTDPIIPFIDSEWVKAKGTTLGGDDGIGIAAQLALLASNDITHGKIECLFTVDEETGLTGAFALEKDFFEGKILLNLDSEDEGIIFIGCAGGADTIGRLNITTEKIPQNYSCLRIDITGLQGGHSGDDINKGLGNAVKLISRFACSLHNQFAIKILNIGGGNLRNAIAREAFVEFAFHESLEKAITELITKIQTDICSEFKHTEKNIFSETSTESILSVLQALPHGVIAMSHAVNGLVETSTNLASIKRINHNEYEIATSQRSSLNSQKVDIMNRVGVIFKMAGLSFTHSVGYPGWSPKPTSNILKISRKAYIDLFGNEPIVTAIHAGLECGLFLEKYPDLDMISFGPTIKGAHSPDERLEIKSVNKFWRLLIEILNRV
jgi:dipeptidase D